MRIARLANFYGPTSGGQRVALDRTGRGFVEQGHDVVTVVPGARDGGQPTDAGWRVHLRSPRLPGTPYRVITDTDRVVGLLERWGPDRLEVSDKLTLTRCARWASDRGVPVVLWSHERADGVLDRFLPGGVAAGLAHRWNRRMTATADVVAYASSYAGRDWEFLAPGRRRLVPLGVDLDLFRPRDVEHRRRGPLRLVCVSRLSGEKRPDLAVEALRGLVDRGVPAELTMVGSGPLDDRLARRSADLPVGFVGHLDQAEVARLLADADVALAPCPVEIFGLGALEALACGTPVVVADAGAAREVVGPAGRPAAPDGEAMAQAVLDLVAEPESLRRRRARERATRFPWSATVDGLLEAHERAATVAEGDATGDVDADLADRGRGGGEGPDRPVTSRSGLARAGRR